MIARTIALVLALAALAAAQDEKAKAEVAKRIDAAKKKAASEYVTLGKWAADKKAHQLAGPCWERAIAYDPENATARQKLGFKKEGDAWVAIPRFDVLRSYAGPQDKKEAIEGEFATRRAKAEKKLADEFYGAGDLARKKGMAAEAEGCFREAIVFDLEHEKARQALGYVREDGLWVSPQDKEAQKANAAKVAGASEGEEWNEETDAEKALGLKLSKRKSERFKVWAYYGGDPLKRTFRGAEAAQAEFYAMFEINAGEALVPTPIELFILETEEQHAVYVDKLSGSPESERKWLKTLSGTNSLQPPRGECWAGALGGPDYGVDYAIHETTHFLWAYHMRDAADHPWIQEGLAYYMSVKLNNTAISKCIGQQSGAVGGGGNGSPSAWKEVVRRGLKDGTDPDMRATFNAQTNSLSGSMTAKAWSLLDWFLTARKKEFMTFLGKMKGGTPQDQAAGEAFGGGYDKLQSDWAAWVKANY